VPFKELMSWEPGKKRWAKMYRRQRYFVVASALGPVHTRDATRAAANTWWEKKRAEIDGPDHKPEEEETVEEIQQRRLEGVDAVLVEGTWFSKSDTRARVPERTVKATGQLFLDVIHDGDMKPMSFREVRDYINHLTEQLGPETDVGVIDATRVEQIGLALRRSELSAGRKKKHWSFFRRYVRYLWSKSLIDLPRNLDSKEYIVTVRPKKIRTYTPRQVRDCLK
jgi:hypothetical protein